MFTNLHSQGLLHGFDYNSWGSRLEAKSTPAARPRFTYRNHSMDEAALSPEPASTGQPNQAFRSSFIKL